MNPANTLTNKIAEKFLIESSSVDLSKFTQIDYDAAMVLSSDQSGKSLSLEGLTSLSNSCAVELAKSSRFGYIDLGGIRKLSDTSLIALSKYKEQPSRRGLAVFC